MHEAILREASGQLSCRFLVASDRLGNATFPNAVIPAEVFANQTGLKPIIAYGQRSGLVAGATSASDIAQQAIERNVRLLEIAAGFHAKFLLWGDNDVVVTSYNWCSASTNHDFPESELGVHIHDSGVGRNLFERLRQIWPEL